MKGLNKMILGAKVRLHHFLNDERGEVNVVATVVLCGVAVILAIIFRDAIGGLITGIINTITNTADKAVTNKTL